MQNFCPSQHTRGAFGTFAGKGASVEIRQTGVAAGDLSAGTAKPVVLGSVFCIPATTNILIDSAADLAGPGSVSLPGTLQLQ